MGQDLKLVLAGLKVKPKAKPEPKPMVLHKQPPKPMPMAELLRDAVPLPTAFELEQVRAMQTREAKPHTRRGPDPRKPWHIPGGAVVERIEDITEGPKTSIEARAQVLKGQEKVMLNNIHVKAAQGKRLTKAERKLKGKWDLARIVAGLRPKQSD